MGFLFLSSLLFQSSLADPSYKQLSDQPTWRALLHQDQVDGDQFFLSPEGKRDPHAELKADIEAFLKPIPDKAALHADHALCRFPARLRFLIENADESLRSKLIQNRKGIQCTAYQEYVERLSPKTTSVVFSSYHMGSPSSIFGHSFLKIGSGGIRNDLLDTGVNFAAFPTTENPFFYALFGVIGLFPGKVTAVPYFQKIREYNDYESRDLWEYELNLSQLETLKLVEHIWELNQTYFDYFYFTENCSYRILKMIEAIAPQFKITKHLPYYVIPTESIKVLYQVPGLVRKIHFRPSLGTQYQKRLDQLSHEEKEELEQTLEQALRSGTIEVASKNSESKIKILDAIPDALELKDPDAILKAGSSLSLLKQKALELRSNDNIPSEELSWTQEEKVAPHLIHPIRRVDLGYTPLASSLSEWTLGFKFAMHELRDPSLGFPLGLAIDFAKFKLALFQNLDQSYSFKVSDITLFELKSYQPYKIGLKKQSYEARFFWENTDQRSLQIEGGPGFTLGLSPTSFVSMIALQNLTVGTGLRESHFQVSTGLKEVFYLELFDHLKFIPEFQQRLRLGVRPLTQFQAQIPMYINLSSNLALAIESSFKSRAQPIWKLSTSYYF